MSRGDNKSPCKVKKIKKLLKNLLTNSTKCAIIIMSSKEEQKFMKGIGDNYGKENDYCRNV